MYPSVTETETVLESTWANMYAETAELVIALGVGTLANRSLEIEVRALRRLR